MCGAYISWSAKASLKRGFGPWAPVVNFAERNLVADELGARRWLRTSTMSALNQYKRRIFMSRQRLRDASIPDGSPGELLGRGRPREGRSHASLGARSVNVLRRLERLLKA